MSIENIRAFYEKVKGNQSLQQKIGELVKEKPAEIEAIIVQVAGENGFKFTLEELRTVIKELAAVAPNPRELNESELETVAGGVSKGGYIGLSITTGLLGCIVASATDKSITGCIINS